MGPGRLTTENNNTYTYMSQGDTVSLDWVMGRQGKVKWDRMLQVPRLDQNITSYVDMYYRKNIS